MIRVRLFNFFLIVVGADSLTQVSLQVNHMGSEDFETPALSHRSRSAIKIKRAINSGNTSLHSSSGVVSTETKQYLPYPRDPSYLDPLDEGGQYLEKKAVASLDSKSINNSLSEILEFPTRSYSDRAQSCDVQDFLQRSFGEMGLISCRHPFGRDDTDNVELANILAYIQGSSEETITIGAHYDDLPLSGGAPGADDNGSGIAALLAIANATITAFTDAMMRPIASIYFVAFAANEGGNLGSAAFADALSSGGVGIDHKCKSPGIPSVNSSHHRAVIMDKVGRSNRRPPWATFQSPAWTKPVMDHLRESSQRHNGEGLVIMNAALETSGDHIGFLNNNISAVLTTTSADDDSIYVPHLNDTLDGIDDELILMIAKMHLGALFRLAGVQTETDH